MRRQEGGDIPSDDFHFLCEAIYWDNKEGKGVGGLRSKKMEIKANCSKTQLLPG